MKVLNIGSMNLDYVYQVDHIIIPGETQSVYEMKIFPGGKGINQSISLAKAGAPVYHCGMIGEDGQVFLDTCKQYGVDATYIRTVPEKTGHTIIQVDKSGQNSILLYGGANQQLTETFIDEVLEHFEAGDLLLLQNEVNLLPYMIERAYEKNMQIALNPSPYNEKIEQCDLSKISVFLLNEVEGEQMTGEKEPEKILDRLLGLYPDAKIVLTLGKEGAVFAEGNVRMKQPCFPVQAVDTTAAGDTFTGYFLAGLISGMEIKSVLEMSARASSIAVTRCGAVPSIPFREEVLAALNGGVPKTSVE